MPENRMAVDDRLMKAVGDLRSVADDIRYSRHTATVLAASVRAIAEEVRTAARDVPALRDAGTGRDGGEAEASGVTITKAEHRRLLIAANEYPAGMFVQADQVRAGMHPSERSVRIVTESGHVHCQMGERSIFSGYVSVGWPVGIKSGFKLVELPRETDAGQWRIWVPEANVVADLDALPLQTRSDGHE